MAFLNIKIKTRNKKKKQNIMFLILLKKSNNKDLKKIIDCYNRLLEKKNKY